MSAAGDPLLGTTLGRWRLDRVIGEGGMGRVYLAVQPEIGARVAVKVLASQDEDLVARFFAEARAVNLIRHENVVDIIDLARLPDGRPYIVMEYVDGCTLRDLIKRGPLPLAWLGEAIAQVLHALAAAHAIGIVHRDLKPDNIAVTPGGRAKVLDFGIAKLAPENRTTRDGRVARTQTGQQLGTPEYMAPEQIAGGAVDGRTDLYALGVVLFEAATGRRPFEGATDFEVMRGHVDVAPPSPRALREDMPRAFEDVIHQALAKDPARRFATAAAMANALAGALGELAPEDRVARIAVPVRVYEVEPATPRPRSQTAATVAERPSARAPEPVARGRRWWIPLAAVAGAAAVVALGVAVGARMAGSGHPAVAPAPAPAPTPPPPQTPPPPPQVDAAVVAIAAPADAAAPVDAAVPEAKSHVARIDAGVRGDAPAAPPPDASSPRDAVPSPDPAVEPADDPPASAATGPWVLAPGFDGKHFDPLAYLPRATALARKRYEDAQLTRLTARGTRPTGEVDFASAQAIVRYAFRSPFRSRPVPSGDPRACEVTVSVDPNGDGHGHLKVVVLVAAPSRCDEPVIGAPRCTVQQVWNRAAFPGAPLRNNTAQVDWGTSPGEVSFRPRDLGVLRFPDDCTK